MYYVCYRTMLKSYNRKDFDTLEELNQYYGIDATEDMINRGFSFEYKNKWYLLCKD